MNSKSLSTGKDKEIVVQSNSISRGIYSCSPTARKLIAYCILKINHLIHPFTQTLTYFITLKALFLYLNL